MSWFRKIPEPLGEEDEIDWVQVWSLTHEIVRFVPAEYCYYNHPARPARGFADPNGHGAGNTIEEAVLHALLELVERDATAIWWFNRVQRPAVDIETCDDPLLRVVRKRALQEGREIWALDLTADLGIPVFAVISRATEGPERISFGFGADFDPGVALVRAAGEMQQMLFTFPDAKERPLREWWTSATMANHPYLLPDAHAPSRRTRDYVALSMHDTVAAIHECRGRLEAQGLEVLVLDQTRLDIGLPSVQVIVPGLRHWRPPRLAPGRLYDVPVRLGWLLNPLREDQLNPVFPPA